MIMVGVVTPFVTQKHLEMNHAAFSWFHIDKHFAVFVEIIKFHAYIVCIVAVISSIKIDYCEAY